MWKKIITGIIAMAMMGGTVAAVRAADLQVSPANSYLTIGGGQEQVLTYTLVNDGTQAYQVSLEVVSFEPVGETGQPALLATTDFPYVELVAGEAITVAAGESLAVDVRVAPPLGVAVKEYPLTLLFVAHSLEPTGTGSEVNLRVGTNLIIATDDSGEDKSSLGLEAVDRSVMLVDTFGRASQQLRVVNYGEFGTLIKGELVLRHLDGREVARWDFYPDLVLGHSSRLIRATDGTLDGNGHPTLSTDLVLPRGLLGQYELVATLHSGHPAGESEIQMISWNVLALPYWLVILVLVLAGLAYLISRLTVARRSASGWSARVDKMKRQRQYFE